MGTSQIPFWFGVSLQQLGGLVVCPLSRTNSVTLEMGMLCVYRWLGSGTCCYCIDHMQMKAQKFPAFGFMPLRPHCC